MALFHAFTNPVADGTNTTIVRPSDWNSAHAQALTISGNTAAGGVSAVSGTNIIYQGGNNVTLSADMAGGVGTVVFHGPDVSQFLTTAAQSNHAHTQYLTTAMESNAGSNFVATSQSSLFQHTSATSAITSNAAHSTHVHAAYLTTAALSAHSHNLATTTTNGSQIVVATVNSAGATLAVPPFITTYPAQTAYQFSNSNGVSFGTNGSTVTASHNGLTTAAQSNHSHGVTLNLTNINGTTGGNSNGINLSLSAVVPAQTVQPVAYSAANGSANFSTLSFANSNGVSFSSGTQGVYATVKTDYLTTAMASNAGSNFVATSQSSLFQHTSATTAIVSDRAYSTHSHGNPTLNLTNLSGTTASGSNGLTLSLSAAAPGGGANVVYEDQAETYNNITRHVFDNSNADIWPLFATYASAPGALYQHWYIGLNPQLWNVYGNNSTDTTYAEVDTLNAAQELYHIAGSNVSYRMTGTAAGQSNYVYVDAVMNASASNGSFTSSQLKFANSNGVSFATGTQGIYASVAAGGADGVNIVRIGTTGTTGTSWSSSNATVQLNGSQNITVSQNNSNQIVVVGPNLAPYLTTAAQSNHSHNLATTTTNGSQIVVATTNSAGATFAVPPFITTYTQPGATVFSNSNNVSFGLNGSTVTATATFAQTNQTANFYVSGNTTQLSSTAGIDLRSVSFEGAGIASVGVSNGRVLVSVPAGGGGGDGVNIVQMGAGGNSAGATYSASTGTVHLFGGNNITLSQNNNSISVVGAAGGGGAAATHTMWFPFNEAVNVMGQQGQGTLHLVPVPTPDVAGGIVSFDRLCFPLLHSHATNSTGSVTLSLWFGLYTRGTGTQNTRISVEHSTSFSTGYTFSGTANSSILSGMRLLTVPWSSTINDNRYIVGIVSRTTTGGANCTVSQVLVSNLNSNFSGILGQATNRSYQWPLGWGQYSATTSALPASIAYSQIDGTNSNAMRNPEWFMVYSTA